MLTINNVQAEDAGTIYTVSVSNGFGQTSSRSATLAMDARLPQAGDLRFQQVGAASTTGGYRGHLTSLLEGGQELPFGNAFGAPLAVGPGCPESRVLYGLLACGWAVQTFTSQGGDELSVTYASRPYGELQSTLAQASAHNEVINGMDLDAPYDSAAFSSVRSSSASGPVFTGALSEVDEADLGNKLAQDGMNGKVATAVSFDGKKIALISYSSSLQPAEIYDTRFVLTTKANAAQSAAELAGGGYIITAIGGNEAQGVMLIGTRVSGDTLARKFMAIPGGTSPIPLATGGYATVGIVFSASNGYLWFLGEK